MLIGKGAVIIMQWFKPIPQQTQGAQYKELVHRAWLDWQAAQNYFESVSDPELIDYAIYEVEAARRRYVYMLRRAEDEMRFEGA